MNKNKILSDYKSKISRLNELNKNYYQLDKPLVSDSEFDELKKEVLSARLYVEKDVCTLLTKRILDSNKDKDN